jgi:hypothetical protein
VTRAEGKKCGCGKTDDPAGNCDGSHAKKMCGCGLTASAKVRVWWEHICI